MSLKNLKIPAGVVCDSLIIIGLLMLGVGLFYWLGIGPALTIPGLFLFGLGVFGHLPGRRV